MASKEVMATAPIVVLLLERTFIAGSVREALRKSWPLYIGLACGWILLAAFNLSGPRAKSAGFGLGVPAHVWWMTQAEVLWMYLKLAIRPWPLAIHYGTPYLDAVNALPWLLATAALVVTTVMLLWRRNAIGFVGAWVLIILSPTLCVPVIKEVAAERRMYLPLVGLVALFVVGGYRLIVRDRVLSSLTQCASILAVAVGLAIPLGWISNCRLCSYTDELTLWTETVEEQPGDPLAYFCLGSALMKENQNEWALAKFERSLKLKADNVDARINRAAVLIKLNRAAEAQSELREIVRGGEEYSGAYYNLGVLTLKAGARDEALRYFQKAVELSPGQAEIRLRIGDALTALGSPEGAVKFYEDARRLMPADARLENNLGHALAEVDRHEEAVRHFKAAIELEPEWAEAEFNLATALLSLEHADEAIVHFEKTLRLSPKYAAAEYNLGNALVLAGKEAEAIDHFGKAIELKPTFVEAYANQALALARLGQSAGAIRTAEKAAALAAEQRNVELLTKIRDWLAAYRAEHPDLSPDSN
jgi:tetratricopeptide (TPR) repeat protein